MGDLEDLIASLRSSLESELLAPGSDVPVFVDARLDTSQVDANEIGANQIGVRCSYLIIESERPDPRWGLRVGSQLTPLLLLRLSAVVMRPFGAERFTSPTLFDTFFEQIEATGHLSIESSDLWLPTFLFKTQEIAAGDVYRVGHALFAAGLRYRQGETGAAELLREAGARRNEFRFSPDETKAYRAWHTRVMGEPPLDKNREFDLPDRDIS